MLSTPYMFRDLLLGFLTYGHVDGECFPQIGNKATPLLRRVPASRRWESRRLLYMTMQNPTTSTSDILPFRKPDGNTETSLPSTLKYNIRKNNNNNGYTPFS